MGKVYLFLLIAMFLATPALAGTVVVDENGLGFYNGSPLDYTTAGFVTINGVVWGPVFVYTLPFPVVGGSVQMWEGIDAVSDFIHFETDEGVGKLAFLSLGDAGNNGTYLPEYYFCSDGDLPSVPEPGTISLMLVGLGLASIKTFRRG